MKKKKKKKTQPKDKEKEKELEKPKKKKKEKEKDTVNLKALNHALPKNIQECHDLFFESDFKINPQFEYENDLYAKKFLEQFEEPNGEYLMIAV